MTFYSGSLNDGKKFVDYITNALWTIDENHSQINKAAANGDCQPLPDLFNEIYSTEYNCWRQLKKKKKMLNRHYVLKSFWNVVITRLIN